MPDARRYAYLCADMREVDEFGEWARANRIKLLYPGQQATGHRYDVMTVGRRLQAKVHASTGAQSTMLHEWLALMRCRLSPSGTIQNEPAAVKVAG